MTPAEASQIVGEYRAALEASGEAVAIPVAELPYPRDTIKKALVVDLLADGETTADAVSPRYPVYRDEYGSLAKWTDDPRAAAMDMGDGSPKPGWSREELRAAMELALGFRDGRAALRREFQSLVAELTGVSPDALLRVLNAYHAERIAGG